MDLLAGYLDLEIDDVINRTNVIEKKMKRYIIDCNTKETNKTNLISRDINIIAEIAKNCRNNLNLISQDRLLEIIILYYYIMDILHSNYNTGDIGDYFEIFNFTEILLKYLSFFSKPYVNSQLIH
uniref:Uncharacterized protein n=1 Tax=viral metagenome TaxID=1070528 RepID=A0A6C0I819_9ZZZZ